MANKYTIADAQETYIEDGSYTSKFLKWKGRIDRNPLLRAIIEARADAVTASWKTYGDNAKTVASILDDMRGNGKENFRLMANNWVKIAWTGGDCYCEIVYDDYEGIEGQVPVDLITLPPDMVKQNVKNNRIVNYEMANTGKTYKPEKIFHLAFNPIGAQTHGNSVIEPLNNILIYMESLHHKGSKIFERYIKPTNIIYARSDSTTKLQEIADQWKSVNDSAEGDMVVPEDLVSKVERQSVPQGSVLDPAHWNKVLTDTLLMSSRTSENILGIGTQNSEESARMQMAGFAQMIRFSQKFLSDNLRFQVFHQIYPEKTPGIKWSYAVEPQEEKFNRIMKAIGIVGSSEIPQDLKTIAQIKLLVEAGVFPNE